MTVLLVILIIVCLYIRAHIPPRHHSTPRRQPHRCEFHIDGRVYDIYPDDGDTIESTLLLHKSVMEAKAVEVQLQKKRLAKWGHLFDNRTWRCSRCDISLREYHSVSESERRDCSGNNI